MDNLIKETRLHLKVLSNHPLFDKNFIIDLIKFFSDKIWHEILASFSCLKKIEILNYFFIKNIKLDLYGKLNPNLSHIIKKSTNLLNVCIEEYLTGRKICASGTLVNNFWKKIFWVKIEFYFEVIIKELLTKKEIFTLFFLFFECSRFEKVNDILIKSRTERKIGYTILCFYLDFLPEQYKKLFRNVYKTSIKKKTIEVHPKKKKHFFSNYLNFFYKNPFLFKHNQIICPFVKHSYSISFIKLNSPSFRKITHNLSICGVMGSDIYWVKKTKRLFHSLLINLLLKKLDFEITVIKKNLKIEIKLYNLKKSKQWNKLFKKANLSNFERLGLIFGSAIISLNNEKNTYLNDIITFTKISIWSKYVLGYSFSAINSYQKIFYEFLPKIINDNAISEHLKGGVIFGLSSSLKKNCEIERIFLGKYKQILKSNELPVFKYGVCLALATVLSGGILNPEKSRLYLILYDSVNVDKISAEGAALSIGILFSSSNSIFLLKDLLLQCLWLCNENKIKLLLTSIAFIFSKNKAYCSYLFKKLILEKSPNIRQGAIVIYSLGNFMNTELNSVKTLLIYLSKEIDDYVKFTILTSLGFMFHSKFKIIKEVLFQFINHYNPFIRLGFCFALTLSSLGLKKIKEQVKILQKLTGDNIDFVAQGACFCLGLLYYHSISKTGLVKTVKTLKSIINGTYGSKITRFGAIMGLSILELKKKRKGKLKKILFETPSNLYLFLQYWTWLPNICFGFDILMK